MAPPHSRLITSPHKLKQNEGVAFQGNVGSFSHRAAQHFAVQMFGESETTLVACRSFDEVFETIHTSKDFYGAIPLENTSMGSIDANYDLLWSRSAVITAEVFVPVQHNLISIPNAVLEDIREVYSHPAALDQCRKLFQNIRRCVRYLTGHKRFGRIGQGSSGSKNRSYRQREGL